MIARDWSALIKNEFEQEYFLQLSQFLRQEYQNYQIFPPKKHIFEAFAYPLTQIKVVIIGQDPYHNEGQAHGLAFSVNRQVKIPPSLRNIFQELEQDCHIPIPKHGNLTHWAEQGVFLLNHTLTVRAHQAGSHQQKGWEIFTNRMIKYLNQKKTGVVYLLWGNQAQKKIPLLNQKQNLVLIAPHPSPLSAYQGFFGCRHFSQTNHYLKEQGQKTIKW